METSTIIGILQMGCLLIMVLLTLGVLIQRILMGKGTSARAIQFLAVGFIFPIILILALDKTISAETTAAILGVLAGYLLSDIGRYKPEDSSDKCNATDDTKS